MELGGGQQGACGRDGGCGVAGWGYGQHLMQGQHSVWMSPTSYQCQASILSFFYIPGKPVGHHLHGERISSQTLGCGGGGVFMLGGGLCGGSSARGGVRGGCWSAPGCGSFWGSSTVADVTASG